MSRLTAEFTNDALTEGASTKRDRGPRHRNTDHAITSNMKLPVSTANPIVAAGPPVM